MDKASRLCERFWIIHKRQLSYQSGRFYVSKLGMRMSFQFSKQVTTKQLPNQQLAQYTKKIITKSFLTTSSSFSRAAFNMAIMIGVIAVPSLSAQAYERIVAMSPDVADIVVALGASDKLVGKDATNNNPALKNVPAVAVSYTHLRAHET